MNEDFLKQDCQQQDELISVLYGEASPEDTKQFQTHLRQCVSCAREYEAFSGVRSSVHQLRDLALAGFQPQSPVQRVERKSARAALTSFFNLSPVWMKLGTAVAIAVLCVFGFIGFMKSKQVVNSPLKEAAARMYSEAELKDAVARAVNEANVAARSDHGTVGSVQAENSSDRISVNRIQSQSPKNRRPLSRYERQQLAADLRLVARPDEDGLELLSDRINQ